MSILNNAIKNGDLETVKNLIEAQGYSANYAGFYGLINIYPLPIKVAAQHNQPEILKYLIEKGANINGNEAIYNSPIVIANEKGYIQVVAELLKHDLVLPEWLNKPYLIKKYMNKAIEADDVFAFETLFTCSKADINSTEFNYSSFSKMTLLDKACDHGATEVVAKLIALGANINLVDNLHITTALHRAVFKGKPEIVELLLDNGALVDQTGPENRTALMAASFFKDEKHEKVLELLIKHDADINKIDAYGFSALEYAATSGNANAIKTLLNAGADLNHKTSDGKTAADIAFEFAHIEVVNILTSHGAQPPEQHPIEINEVLISNNTYFTSDIIIEHQSPFLQTGYTQPEYNFVKGEIPAMNTTLEQQEHVFG